MEITKLHFWIIILFLAITFVFSVLFYFFYKKRERLKKKYFLLFDQSKFFYLKYLFLLSSFFILLLSIFWIEYEDKTRKSQANWIDIVFVLDVSKSMNALDYKDWNYDISRLDFSKNLIWEYITNNPQNRYWLVVFAWEAISSLPLTTDSSVFLSLLSSIDYRNLSVQWTNLWEAVEFWYKRLLSSDKDRSKAIFLISDWADEKNISFDFSDKLLDSSIKYLVLWVWSKAWTKIPAQVDTFGRIIYEKYKWEYVITSLNNSALKKLASVLDWEYLEFDDVWNLSSINNILSSLEKKAIEIWESKNKRDFSRFLSIISFILFLFYLIIPILISFKNKKIKVNN